MISLVAIVTLCLGNTFHARNVVASVLVMVWASRLAGGPCRKGQMSAFELTAPCAGFLLYRVLKRKSDTRFDTIRSHFFKFLGTFHLVNGNQPLTMSVVPGFWIGMHNAKSRFILIGRPSPIQHRYYGHVPVICYNQLV